MRRASIIVMAIAAIAILAVFAISPKADAQDTYFDDFGCSAVGCHDNDTATCDGCHAHGTHTDSAKGDINVTATTDKTVYTPGEAMTVTVDGGYRAGWVRVILYDENGVEITRSTGPTGQGDDGGGGFELPVTLDATAPATDGSYIFNASWYGNEADDVGAFFGAGWTPDLGNSGHGEEIVSTNSFTVSETPVPDIALSTAAIAFGSVTAGSSSDETVTVANNGNADLTIGIIAQGDPLAAPFSIVSDNCSGQTVAASGACTFAVRFAPVSADTFGDTFDVPSDDPDEGSVTVSLSGAGASTNNPPTTPELIYPTDGADGLGTTIEVIWNASTDPDGDTVSYQLFVSTDSEFTGTAPIEVASLSARGISYAGLGLGVVWLGAAFASGLSRRRKIILVALTLAALGALLASCGGDNEWEWDEDEAAPSASAQVSYRLTGLQPDTTYYWQVVAGDGQGGTSESEVRTFTTE